MARDAIRGGRIRFGLLRGNYRIKMRILLEVALPKTPIFHLAVPIGSRDGGATASIQFPPHRTLLVASWLTPTLFLLFFSTC
jgi:hypothetical protein